MVQKSKNSNACRFLTSYASKWYEARRLKKLFRGSNFVQEFGPSYKKRRHCRLFRDVLVAIFSCARHPTSGGLCFSKTQIFNVFVLLHRKLCHYKCHSRFVRNNNFCFFTPLFSFFYTNFFPKNLFLNLKNFWCKKVIFLVLKNSCTKMQKFWCKKEKKNLV